jgi:hypothetical protein
MPSESAILEKLHTLDIRSQVDSGRLDTLEGEKNLLWGAVDKIRDAISGIRAQVAAIVAGSAIIQTFVTAFIVWKITRGNP